MFYLLLFFFLDCLLNSFSLCHQINFDFNTWQLALVSLHWVTYSWVVFTRSDPHIGQGSSLFRVWWKKKGPNIVLVDSSDSLPALPENASKCMLQIRSSFQWVYTLVYVSGKRGIDRYRNARWVKEFNHEIPKCLAIVRCWSKSLV